MPLPSIRTDRLLLRPLQRDDVDALHQVWTAPEVRRYLWDDVVIPRETAQQVIESHLATVDRLNLGFWALHILPVSPFATPTAGFCGFRLIDDGPEIELLYGLRGKHWGKGLATEASTAALDYLWRSTSYQRVYARTDPPNGKSVQVMRRLGMKHESTTPSTITYVLYRSG
jgi:[ribosomal protein S5]-alanine N-acetyltransferase